MSDEEREVRERVWYAIMETIVKALILAIIFAIVRLIACFLTGRLTPFDLGRVALEAIILWGVVSAILLVCLVKSFEGETASATPG